MHKKTTYDHLGNEFPSTKAMCQHYGITVSVYHNRIKLGWSIKSILTRATRAKTHKAYDHLGNEFPSITTMCQHYGITRSAYAERIKHEWSIEKALTTPMGEKRKSTVVDHKGQKFRSIKEMCASYGINMGTFVDRIRHGRTLEDALTTPTKQMQHAVVDHLGNKFSSVSAMCRHYHISNNAYLGRIKRGQSTEKALMTPTNPQRKTVIDHIGNEFESIEALCKHYGITASLYGNRIGRNWPLEKILTTPVVQRHRTEIEDHKGNKFASLKELCDHYKITQSMYHNSVKRRWSIIESLKIIPHIHPRIKNADIIPNLRVINHVCDNTYLVVHNGTETLMHYDEIIRFATEYFRAQNEQNAATV